jgi:SH3 domain-containing YSC84-like protein 1
MTRMKCIARLSGIMTMVVVMTVGLGYAADETEKGKKIVDDMTQVFNNMTADPDMGWFRSNLKRAQGVLIMRQYRAGFIVGASGGRGVMLARDKKTGKWSYPAFYGQGTGRTFQSNRIKAL